MPRTTVALKGGASVAVETKLEEAILATSLRKLVKSEQSRTAALRDYAESMVALRLKLAAQLALPLSEVARSAPYRDAVGRAYAKAGVSEDSVPEGTSRAALGASIRYHVAEVLREKGLAAEAGIALESPSTRLTAARQALAVKRESGGFVADVFAPTLKWMTAIEEPAEVTEDVMALVKELESQIRRLRRLAKQS